MSLTALGKVSAALWIDTPPVDTSFLWMRIFDTGTPDIVVPYWFDGTNWVPLASKFWLDAVISLQNNPPGSPAGKSRYLIGTAPTGAWAGHDNNIATWTGTAWDYLDPEEGMSLTITSTKEVYTFTGGVWEIIGEVIKYIVDISTTPIACDFKNKRQLIFEGSADIAGAKTWRFDNEANGLLANIVANFTTPNIAQIFPSNVKRNNLMSDWDIPSHTWTPGIVGIYNLSFTRMGANWLMNVDGPI